MTIIEQTLLLLTLAGIPLGSYATAVVKSDNIAVSAYLGGRISSDLEDAETAQSAKISDNLSRALAISWAYKRNQEGELLFSNSQHNLKMSGEKKGATDLYISYLQFGGRVLFTDNTPFATNLGLGIGATFLTPSGSRYDKEIALSGNITGGLRYNLNRQWALLGELRFYGTLLNSSSTLFCADGQCLVRVKGKAYLQSELMAGIKYQF